MEFSELFVHSVRQLLPVARKRHLVPYFDCNGARIELLETDDGIRAGIHRMLLGMLDCLDTGFVMFSADSEPPVDGISRLVIHAAGTEAAAPEVVEAVLHRLDMQLLPPEEAQAYGYLMLAEGRCPATGARAQFLDTGPDGLVISLELQVPAAEIPDHDPVPHADGASAWLVNALPGGFDSVGRRLRRLGWQVTSIGSLERALTLLAAARAGAAELPMLLVVAEDAGVELSAMESIAAAMPATWVVLAVLAGSPTIARREHTAVDVRVQPFSPLELERFTAHVDQRTTSAEMRETCPAPLYVQEARRILVVEDSPVNQLIARAQLEGLGYDVEVVGDGAEALDSCRQRPPDMVLMDIDMPVMDGLEATEQMRSWQQVGRLPPFPIVAATDSQLQEECLRVGMDGYLSKPMDLHTLADELHRVLPKRPAGYDSVF